MSLFAGATGAGRDTELLAFPASNRLRSALSVTTMLVLTEAVYMRPEILRGTSSLDGSDYEMLHQWRIAFARRALSGASHTLPAWDPHELLGAPFSANLQSFPWIPTRLVLFFFDPAIAFGAGVAIAAALAALFTWLYCRRMGLSRIASAAAGWTFAAAGYFSSRVFAGHLPLLEAYPALPLLLWLVDRAFDPERARRFRFDLTALAVCCTFVVSAGHPQVPAYALGAAFLYVFWRGRDAVPRARARVRVAGAMTLGIGLASAIWWPMLLLIGRSTRVLHLAAPDNDVAMPWGRLPALLIPGFNGWAAPISLADDHPFTGYPNNSFFWDTASYIGILPLVAIVALLIVCLLRKRMPTWRGRYLAVLGVGAFLLSLPIASPLLHALPGTLLRSPARLLYLSTFCAAVALGSAVDLVRAAEWPWPRIATSIALGILLTLHAADLSWFDHWFVSTTPLDRDLPAFQATLDRELGAHRIASEREDTIFSDQDRYDDAGGFDSIFLARFNRGYLALAGERPDTNEQVFDASVLPPKALEALGVGFVITTTERKDLPQIEKNDDNLLYRVPNPAPRVNFFPASRAEFADPEQIPAIFASGSWDRLLLEPSAKDRKLSGDASGTAGYSRPSSDEIEIRTASAGAGFVEILEAWDPGWTATVDNYASEVLPANGFAMAVPVPPGDHVIRLRYGTPGRALGTGLSVLDLVLLVLWIGSARSEHSKPRLGVV